MRIQSQFLLNVYYYSFLSFRLIPFLNLSFLFADVILFCIKANFTDDSMSLLFGEDNGVRGVLLNGKSQIPLLQVRNAFFRISFCYRVHSYQNVVSRLTAIYGNLILFSFGLVLGVFFYFEAF